MREDLSYPTLLYSRIMKTGVWLRYYVAVFT